MLAVQNTRLLQPRCCITRSSRGRSAAGMKAKAAPEPAGAAAAAAHAPGHTFSQTENYSNLCSNMGALTERPVSGYVGRWARYQGQGSELLAEGDIVYGFRHKDGQPNVSQVWKAEEGDLTSPKLQRQRDQLPQLQKDPLQLALAMDTLIVEVADNTPLLEPSLAAAAAAQRSSSLHPAGLASAMRVLAVPGWGNLVVTGGLPAVGQLEGKDLGEAFKTWFNRFYIRVPGRDGGKRWSVMLHYDTGSGAFLTHYHTWEAAISPAPDSLQQVFTPGAHKHALEQAQLNNMSLGSIDAYYAKHSSKLECSYTLIAYNPELECSISSGSSSRGASVSSGSSSSAFEQLHGGPEAFEVWYESGCYFRAPHSLHPDVLSGRDVVLEAGAVVPFGSDGDVGADVGGAEQPGGLVRWLLCYSSSGDRRVKWARHEVYSPTT